MTCDLVRKLVELLPLRHCGALGSRCLTVVQDRPCARCVKRSIGHLCHDEPREPTKSSKSEQSNSTSDNGTTVKDEEPLPYILAPSLGHQQGDQQILQEAGEPLVQLPATSGTQMDSVPLMPRSSNAINQGLTFGDKNQQCKTSAYQLVSKTDTREVPGYNDWNYGGQNQFQDMHSLHPSYLFNAPDINNEYNLLNEFLSSSLLDDPSIFPNDEIQALNSDPSLGTTLLANINVSNAQSLLSSQQIQSAEPAQASFVSGNSIQRPKSVRPTDKEEDKYYMTIADPSGNDTPEERMNKVFTAKYNAGMLRPFNYIQGYARLHRYMDKTMQPASRQRILRQLDKFRPKFRERMQSLTDRELTLVEMWFERSLMEYDRVFASMAIPACCWRRTGEIFRGNKEMAELIHVPIEKLRDVSICDHQGSVVADETFRRAS